MFDTLNKVLRVETTPLEDLPFVHISCGSDGAGIANSAFLSHHFISYYLKHNYKVCLLSCAQTLTQYKVIQHKLGNNLEKASTDKKFAIVSLPTMFSSPDDTTSQALSELSSLLYNKLTEALHLIQGADMTTPCLLVLDELSTLTDLGMSTADILLLLCKLKRHNSSHFTSLLTSCYKLDPDIQTVEQCSLNNQLTLWSYLTFNVAELSTGLSKDVHGQLAVRWMKGENLLTPKEELYHYKTSDRDLKIFAVGASPAVL